MKKPKIYASDYIFIALAIAFLTAVVLSGGPSALLVIAAVLAGGYAIYFIGKIALRLIHSAEDAGKFDKPVEWLKKSGSEVFGLVFGLWFTILLFWIGFKVVASFFSWLKNGYWQFYDYQPACSSLDFACNPTTGFVKINEFLFWIYHFDITIFLWAATIAALLILAWGKQLSKPD